MNVAQPAAIQKPTLNKNRREGSAIAVAAASAASLPGRGGTTLLSTFFAAADLAAGTAFAADSAFAFFSRSAPVRRKCSAKSRGSVDCATGGKTRVDAALEGAAVVAPLGAAVFAVVGALTTAAPAPPDLAAASFSLRVSGRPRVAGVSCGAAE